MKVEQLYTNCLSEAAYYIESNGEAAIVDPIRDYHQYIERAKKDNATIKYVFETHFHADFVSGHIDLAKATGAKIIYGPSTETSYPVYVASDGEKFLLGGIEIEAMHTPGHTPESTSYLLRDENKKDYCVFTGDTLFVGDVGRPDLLGGKFSKEEMAGWMYDSLNKKIKTLADDVIVYPAHGPGSACGKNLGKETFSTIGVQKKLNYALQEMSKEEFVKKVTEGISAPPQYFPLNAAINKKGYLSFDEIVKRNLKAISVDEFETEIKNGATVLDTRNENSFVDGFVKGSIFIGLNGRFAEWVGTILKIDEPLILVCDEGKEEEAITRMARVGYENVKGFLHGGFESWKNANKPVDMVITIDVEEMALDLKHENNITVMDVRKETEFENAHLENAKNVVLQNFESQLRDSGISSDENIFVHCQAGYRSVIAASIMKRKGFTKMKNIAGGWNAIVKTDMPVVVPAAAQ